MAKELVTDEMWEVIEPLLPAEGARRMLDLAAQTKRGLGAGHWVVRSRGDLRNL